MYESNVMIFQLIPFNFYLTTISTAMNWYLFRIKRCIKMKRRLWRVSNFEFPLIHLILIFFCFFKRNGRLCFTSFRKRTLSDILLSVWSKVWQNSNPHPEYSKGKCILKVRRRTIGREDFVYKLSAWFDSWRDGATDTLSS